MMATAMRNLLDVKRGRTIGDCWVGAWNARIPGTLILAPGVGVTRHDDGDDDGSFVWALTEPGRAIADRIARHLAVTGHARLWAHEFEHVAIFVGTYHTLHLVSGPVEII